MVFHLQTVHVQVDKTFEEFVEEKFAKLEKFFSNEPQITVIIKKERFEFTVEAKIQEKGAPVFAKETSTDLSGCVENLFNKLKNHLSKAHDRKVDRIRK